MSGDNIRIIEIAQGLPGKGIPALGSEGQVLKKASDFDYDTEWENLTASEIELEAIAGIEGTEVQTAINELALNELRVVAPVKLVGSGNNTDTNTVSIDMDTVSAESSIQPTDKLLIQRGSTLAHLTYDKFATGDTSYLRGSVDLVVSGNSGTVSDDPLNATISEGVAPTVLGGEPTLGVHYIVENTSVFSSITGSLLEYNKGDYVEWDGASWSRIIRTLDDYVESFNGRSKVVTPQAGDYSADQVTNAADKTTDNTFDENVTITKVLEVIGNSLFNSVEGMKLPVGTTLQRPVTPIEGYFRFNTDSKNIEVYDGTSWVVIDIDVLTGAIQQVADDLAVVEGRVTVNETSISNNSSDITDLVTDVSQNTTDISGLRTDVDLNAGNIILVDDKADINTGAISALDTIVDDIGIDLQDTKDRVTINEENIATNTISIGELDTRVVTNEASITSLDTRVGDTESDITALGLDKLAKSDPTIDAEVKTVKLNASSNPAATRGEGTLKWNETSKLVEYSDGNNWLSINRSNIISVDSIIDLEALEGTKDGQIIKMTGYYAGIPLDDMPDYIVDINSNAIPDGGSVIARVEGGCFLRGKSSIVSAAHFGAREGINSSPSINKALLYGANSGGIPVLLPPDKLTINDTLLMGPGALLFGVGTRDGVDSFAIDSGTVLTGVADPMIYIKANGRITDWPSNGSAGAMGQNMIKDISLYSQVLTTQKAIIVGESSHGTKKFISENITTRGWDIDFDLVNVYEVSIRDFSLRGLGGTASIRIDGEITSGSISDGAIYSFGAGIDLISPTCAGFSINNIDFDNCDYCAKTSGYILNPGLFNNCASEGTNISDFHLEHIGLVGINGFAAVTGISSEDRILCKGAGKTIISNCSLNDLLFSPGKVGVRVEGTAEAVVIGGIARDYWGRCYEEGDLIINSVRMPRKDELTFSNFQDNGVQQYLKIPIGNTPDSRTLVFTRFKSGGLLSVGCNAFGATTRIWAIGHNGFSTDYTATILGGITPYGTFSNDGDNLQYISSATFDNQTLAVSFPIGVRVWRKDIYDAKFA